jgi:hypothetical protein
MIVQHIIHGFLIIVVVFFGLPAIYSFAASTLAGSRTSSSLSIRFLYRGLHIIVRALASLSDAIASGIAGQYPEKEAWLKPLLKQGFTALFVFGSLYLVSILTGG